MRKILSIFIVCVMVFSAIPAYASDSASISINGEVLEFGQFPPIMADGVLLAPFYPIAEFLGIEILQLSDLQYRFTYKDKRVTLQIDNPSMTALDYGRQPEIVPLTAPPRMINGAPYMPIAAIAEEFGWIVTWNGATNIQSILIPVLAVPTASTVFVNGVNTEFDAYNIEGSNYFKLRDLAHVLNGAEKQFSVDWNGVNDAISLASGGSYIPVGGEMSVNEGRQNIMATPSVAAIYLDSERISLTAYSIVGNNFFRLRDIMELLDVYVGWEDDAPDTITVDAGRCYRGDCNVCNFCRNINIPITGSLENYYSENIYRVILDGPGKVWLAFEHTYLAERRTVYPYRRDYGMVLWNVGLYNPDDECEECDIDMMQLCGTCGENVLEIVPEGDTPDTVSKEILLDAGIYYVKVTSDDPEQHSNADYILTVNYVFAECQCEPPPVCSCAGVNIQMSGNLEDYAGSNIYEIEICPVCPVGIFSFAFEHGEDSDMIFWIIGLYNADDDEKILEIISRGDIPEAESENIELPPGTYYVKINSTGVSWQHSDIEYTLIVNFETEEVEYIPVICDLCKELEPPVCSCAGINIQVSDNLEDYAGSNIYEIELFCDVCPTIEILITFEHEVLEDNMIFWIIGLYNADNDEKILEIISRGDIPEVESKIVGLLAGTYYIKVGSTGISWQHSDIEYTLTVKYEVEEIS